MTPETSVAWTEAPEEHDFENAREYLELLLSTKHVGRALHALREAGNVRKRAKDLLRASRLPLLPREDHHVAKDLDRVARGDRLPPVLLLRGKLGKDVPLAVADGYHRICASYHVDPDTEIPCRIVKA